MQFLFWLLIIAYLFLIGVFLRVWKNINTPSLRNGKADPLRFSIIIPVRNEETNIINLLQDISRQNYPTHLFEVLVINDHSTDNTSALVSAFTNNTSNIKLVNLADNNPVISYKKKAINTGISFSQGEVIITTDGDCRLGANWLSAIDTAMSSHKATAVCGPVMYWDDKNFFTNLQIIEFAALIGSGAATLSLGYPGMCNGANFTYTKKGFIEVKGFEGIDAIASGDDELLMHKILNKCPGKVVFLKDPKGIVWTAPNKNLKHFFNQRKRWASKWTYYKNSKVKVLALFIFSVNLYLSVGPLLCWAGWMKWEIFIIQYLLKAIIEYLFIRDVLTFFNKKLYLAHFLFLQIVYPLYTVFFGVVANFGGYEWKGRKVT